FFKRGLEEGVEHSGGVIVLILDPAPGHFAPKSASFSFVFVEGAIHRGNYGLAPQFGRLHAEHLTDPLDEVMQGPFAKQRIDIVAARSRYPLDLLLVPSGTFNS